MDDAAPARMADLTPHAPQPGATAVLTEMSAAYRTLLEAVGEDPQREGLLRTPLRAAKAFSFLTQGYSQNLEKLVNGAIFASENREMVIVNNIEFHSLCEHHLLPFSGRAHVAYLPSGHVIGLSKIPRIVDMFARRLQIQENMTRQIAECLQSAVQADGVAVVLEGQHQCMMMRGVEKQQASMTTSAMLGRFREDARTRGEFLSLIRQRS